MLKKYKFPCYENEKFVGEGVIWSIIAHDYDMVFFNKALYICEYLPDGLTKSGRKMRLENPYGGAFHTKEYLNKIYSLKVREKNALLYLVYIRFEKKNIISTIINENFDNNIRILLFFNIIPSYLLYVYWKFKYMR